MKIFTIRLLSAALVAAATIAVSACSVESEQEVAGGDSALEDDLERAGHDLAEGTRRVGDAIERAGERLEREAGPYLNDAAITAKVKARLVADPEVNPFRIDVDTVDGTVTLNGVVATEEQREEAEKLAARTEGVVQVINVLRVGTRQAGAPVPGRALPPDPPDPTER